MRFRWSILTTFVKISTVKNGVCVKNARNYVHYNLDGIYFL